METANATLEQEIINCEMKLLSAFEQKDIEVLEALIHNEALFVLPNGLSVTKAMVLNNYKEGNTKMASLKSSDQKVSFIGDNAIVSLDLEMKGKYFDKEVSSKFRYLRVWKKVQNKWVVISTCGVQSSDE